MLAEKQDQLMPKKKFTFTKRTKEKETSSYDVVSDKDKNAGQLISTAILTNPLQHGIFSKRDEICVMKVILFGKFIQYSCNVHEFNVVCCYVGWLVLLSPFWNAIIG